MTKNYMHEGKWTEKTSAPKVVVCECGNKYIKTRPRQKLCLPCISQEAALRR